MIKTLAEQKKYLIKRLLNFNSSKKKYLFKNEIMPKSQQRFKSEAHNIYAVNN